MRLSRSLARKRRERVAATKNMESRENVRLKCVVHQGEDVMMEPHSESGRGRGSQLREEEGPRRTGGLWGGVQAHWNSFYFLSRGGHLLKRMGDMRKIETI